MEIGQFASKKDSQTKSGEVYRKSWRALREPFSNSCMLPTYAKCRELDAEVDWEYHRPWGFCRSRRQQCWFGWTVICDTDVRITRRHSGGRRYGPETSRRARGLFTMKRAKPGYNTLVQAGITNEGEAERLARSGNTSKPSQLKPP